MTMTLFAPLVTYPDPVDDSHLGAIIAVARHLGAQVTAAGVEVDIPDVKNKLAEAILHLSDQIRAAERKSHEHAARLLRHLAQLAAEAGVVLSQETVRAGPAFLDDMVARQARFHDLAVLPLHAGDMGAPATAEAVIFGSGRPALFLPGPAAPLPRFDTVVFATDYGRPAARALFDALPFLSRARAIHAVTVKGEKDLSQASEAALAAVFERRGLAATISSIELGEREIGAALQDHVEGLGGGLLVMGAYGHSRLREFVLGGATRSVLYDLRQPVLMSG